MNVDKFLISLGHAAEPELAQAFTTTSTVRERDVSARLVEQDLDQADPAFGEVAGKIADLGAPVGPHVELRAERPGLRGPPARWLISDLSAQGTGECNGSPEPATMS